MEKSIKLVAFDMDGTVLDSKLRLPKGLFEMIESHPNVKFVVASGRQYLQFACVKMTVFRTEFWLFLSAQKPENIAFFLYV